MSSSRPSPPTQRIARYTCSLEPMLRGAFGAQQANCYIRRTEKVIDIAVSSHAPYNMLTPHFMIVKNFSIIGNSVIHESYLVQTV